MKTLKEKIEVMQAALERKEIELNSPTIDNWKQVNYDNQDIVWDWFKYDYRVKPEPMEFWVSIFDSGSTIISATYAEAPANTKTIKVREVIE